MAEPALKYLAVEDFLRWDDGSDRRYVQEILMIAADEPGAELWRRIETGWTVADLRLTHELSLESVGISFPLASLYDGIEFPAAS